MMLDVANLVSPGFNSILLQSSRKAAREWWWLLMNFTRVLLLDHTLLKYCEGGGTRGRE
jgi:hypothetical protein